MTSVYSAEFNESMDEFSTIGLNETNYALANDGEYKNFIDAIFYQAEVHILV